MDTTETEVRAVRHHVGAATTDRPAARLPRRLASTVAAPVDAERACFRELVYRRALAAADALAVVLAVTVAAASGTAAAQWLEVAGLVALTVTLSKCLGLYDRDARLLAKTTLDELPALTQVGVLLGCAVWAVGDPLFHTGEWGRLQSLVLVGSHILIAYAGRRQFRAVLAHLLPPERLLVVADPETADRLAQKLRSCRVPAEIIVRRPVRAASGRPLDAPTAPELRELRHVHRLDRLVVAPVSTDAADTLEFLRSARSVGLRVSVLPRMLEVVGSASSFDHIEGITMLGVPRMALTRSSKVLKRTMDLIGAAILLVALAPAVAVIAASIKLDSRGPVLFRQLRVGRSGRPFSIYKFRTMVPDADARKDALRPVSHTGALFKLTDDPRVTRVGRRLRATSLDEIPQLLNVLRGDMSLVGPRPLILEEDVLITGAYRDRLRLTPGMTGPWQILGSARVPLEEMVNLDYLYVANWSLWQDLLILLRTIPYAIGRRSH